MKKLLKQIHLWLSIPVGIFFSLLCLTGAILVYEDELLELFHPRRYFVEEVKMQSLPMEQMVAKAQLQLPDSIRLTDARIPKEENRNYAFGVQGMRKSLIYVDPYTGNVQGQRIMGEPDFFRDVMRLHRWLMMPMKRGEFNLGKFITGWATLISVFILLTGIIIWIPKKWKNVKKRLSIKTGKGTYRFWYDFHLSTGMFSVVFLLALCLTGLTWSFPWYRTAFYQTFGVEMQQGGHGAPPQQQQTETKAPAEKQMQNAERNEATRGERPQHVTAENHTHEGRNPYRKYIVWQKVVDELRAQRPDAEMIRMSDGSASVVAKGANFRMSDKYTFDGRTGDITSKELFKDTASKQQKVQRWIIDIHFGTWAGWFSKLLTFLAALIGAALPITGYYMWWKKLSKKL